MRGIVGPNAGDLIAEAALAIEMGSDAADIGLTIHSHRTLSETIGMAAEAFEGAITDLYLPNKKKKKKKAKYGNTKCQDQSSSGALGHQSGSSPDL